jgi:hypothetical protein
MNKLLDEIFSHPSLIEKPPVLLDIGASGEIHSAWKLIAKYSTCIAFDADTRDFDVTEQNDRGYKRLFRINRVVAAEAVGEMDFYLTRSPHCSSALEPDNQALIPWAFRDLFDVREKIKLPVTTLSETLSECGVDYVDWYKTDSQGTDLRLFKSLPLHTRQRIITAEFEPGIIDAYKHEDKLHTLMQYLDSLPFWVTDMHIKGSQRINKSQLDNFNKFQQRFLGFFLKTSPGWCEISYLNKFENNHSERDLLLGWVVAMIKKESGFAMHLANQGFSVSKNQLFKKMLRYYQESLDSNGFVGYFKFLFFAIKRIIKRIKY